MRYSLRTSLFSRGSFLGAGHILNKGFIHFLAFGGFVDGNESSVSEAGYVVRYAVVAAHHY